MKLHGNIVLYIVNIWTNIVFKYNNYEQVLDDCIITNVSCISRFNKFL